MKLQLIRNATLVLDYAGHHILIDPYFAPKQSRPSYIDQSPNVNPMADLPIPPERILEGVEVVIVSHLHSDHFDTTAQELIPKPIPLLCQPENEAFIRDKGFVNVSAVSDEVKWQGIHLTRIGGHHGMGEVETMMGTVSGFVFQAKGEPTLYWLGDTVLCDEVREAVRRYQPDAIVTHSCGAKWPDSANQRHLIVMDSEQTIELCRFTPQSVVIAAHMDSLDHATVSRSELRSQAQQAGINNDQLRIPLDGEALEIPHG
jgi:L-ascorbate metabolism protein UlaG (beta-lactamase superfamily)